MKGGLVQAFLLMIIGQGSIANAQQTDTNLPGAFKGIVAANSGNVLELPKAFSYAARPDFSQPSLSPLGTRVAFITRQADSVATLVVLDITSKEIKPITKLEIPNMKSVRTYGWASEERLVVWVDINTSTSSDDNPSSSLYIAQLDLKTRKVTERTQGTKMTADVEAPYPLSSDLVRAPWRDPNHVLISECSRKGGVKFKQRGDAVNFTFASTETLVSNTVACQLLDWNLETNRASYYGKPFYGYPTRFLANLAGDQLFAESRKLGGKMMHASWDAKTKKWLAAVNENPAELQEIWDSSELDYPQVWASIHKVLPDRLSPAGSVVKTANLGQPLGLQFNSPDLRFGPFDNDSAAAQQVLTNTFADYNMFAGSTIKWLGATDDRSTILFSVDSATNPGTYFVWRRSDNTIARITNMRALSDQQLGTNYLEPGWLPGYLPVAVTPARNTRHSKGMVLMPLVIDDVVAAAQLHTVDLTAEWFAVNGLTVVRVPVGLPAALPAAQRGEVWRRQVAQRLELVAKNVRQEFKLDADDPACIYGKDSDAYAALAGIAYDSSLSCAIAINAKLESKLFTQPYTNISTTSKNWYLSSNNVELRMWKSLYGSDLIAGAPGAWTYPATSKVMAGFEMFDEHRALSTFTAGLDKAISKAGGKLTVYDANLDSSKTDLWLSNLHEAMLKYILPPSLGKVGKVYVGEVEDTSN